ncbi:MAG TPA: metallophosphoesterase [Clostridiales bacterium]|nr:metallophosphoesterase [Clostridiales bacterium]
MKNIKKKSKQRRMVLTVLLVIIFALPIWVYWGNISIQTTQISINSEKIPESFKGFKIVQVSDLHNTEFGQNQSKLLRKVGDASPNIIVVTGDLIDSNNIDVEKAMDFITGAVRIAPVYYVTGNHEARTDKYVKLEEEMTRAGVIILKDKVITLGHDGDFIQLLGLDDPDFTMKGDTHGESAVMIDTKLKSMQIGNGQYTILLSHRPELFDVYVSNRMDLILSGHAHGGQIRLPFIGGLVAPNQGFFPTYSEGVYEKKQTKMVVSRGLGNSIIPVRINNRPELVVITLASQQN